MSWLRARWRVRGLPMIRNHRQSSGAPATWVALLCVAVLVACADSSSGPSAPEGPGLGATSPAQLAGTATVPATTSHRSDSLWGEPFPCPKCTDPVVVGTGADTLLGQGVFDVYVTASGTIEVFDLRDETYRAVGPDGEQATGGLGSDVGGVPDCPSCVNPNCPLYSIVTQLRRARTAVSEWACTGASRVYRVDGLGLLSVAFAVNGPRLIQSKFKGSFSVSVDPRRVE